MIIVVSYEQEEDVLNNRGNVVKPKGKYVDYGLDTVTLETVTLPPENFSNFVRENCIFEENIGEYVLKDIK